MDFHAETADTLIENFALLGEWEARYAYLLDLGKKLPEFPTICKTEAHLVRGCVSQVWLVPRDAGPGRVGFLADSDSHIVRGLIALLMVLMDGKDAATVRDTDVEAFFNALGLGEHLSPNRRNGFFAMVGRIKTLPGGADA
jgi:cysteine desulfuration protein SufE